MFRHKMSINLVFTLLLILIGIFFVATAKPEISEMIFLILIIFICYNSILSHIKRNSDYESLICDSRFYVFSAITLYTLLPPIYCILTLDENGGARVRTAYRASTYTSEQLLATIFMSALFFAGILLGVIFRSHVRSRNVDENIEYDDINRKKLFIGWMIICAISTFLFLLPFFRGGFNVIQAGGTILDVDRTISNSFLGKIQEVFFSSEIMTVSTVAMLYYGYRLDISLSKRRIILLAVVLIQIIIAILTTRRARGLSIILCAFVIYVFWYQNERKKLPITQILIAIISVMFLYFLEVFMGQRQVNNNIVSYIQIFDGISAYDSLLKSTSETTSIYMLSNILYGIFRPIPILGKYLVQLFGMPNDAAPLYHWMADRYSTYQYGGGLAYLPQLEAYLSAGYLGCFIFGILYGYIFGKKRKGLVNLFLIAMSFSIARGNLQVILSLIWPYGIIGYYFYGRFLLRKVTIGSSLVYDTYNRNNGS